MNAPVIGADAGYAGPDSWTVAFSWRYQKSDRHFTGSEEEPERQAENSEVINWANMLEVAITRSFNDRWSLTFGIPYFIMERSNAIRDPSQPDNEFGNSPVVARTSTNSAGLGDITVVPRYWAFKPETHPNYNLSLGFGVKLPTGEQSVEDTFQVRVDTPGTTSEPFVLTNQIRTVDQSIQLGDGGLGFIMDVQGFYRFGKGRAAGYLTLTYLVNPDNTNHVPTYRGGDPPLLNTPGSEAYMSVPDQYLYRIGATWFASPKTGLSLGARWEGIPTHDLVGESDGFRRPGYAFSVEPGISYTSGPHTFSFLMPIAVYRNRQKSVPDLEVPPRHGDAAFADYVFIMGYFRRFGGVETPSSVP
jgi:hypothetical protein